MKNNLKLREITHEDEKQWRELLKQLNPNREVKSVLKHLADDKNFFGIVAEKNGKVVGFGSIAFYRSSFKGLAGTVEDIIVHVDNRRQGIGRQIFQALMKEAEERKSDYIFLTSNPKKEAARKMYESEGFELYETGYFIKKY